MIDFKKLSDPEFQRVAQERLAEWDHARAKERRADRWLVACAEDAMGRNLLSDRERELVESTRRAVRMGGISPAQRKWLGDIASKSGQDATWSDVPIDSYVSMLDSIGNLCAWNLVAPKLQRDRLDILSTISPAHAQAHSEKLAASASGELSDEKADAGQGGIGSVFNEAQHPRLA